MWMRLGVVGKLVAFGHYPGGYAGPLLNLTADLEEGRPHPIFGERVEALVGLPTQQGFVERDRDPRIIFDVVPNPGRRVATDRCGPGDGRQVDAPRQDRQAERNLPNDEVSSSRSHWSW